MSMTEGELIAHWQAALAEGRVLMQYCPACTALQFYPRPFCARCWSTQWQWQAVSGAGSVYSYTIAHVATGPAPAGPPPHVIAIVELAEGPRLTSNIVNCDPASVTIGMAVQAVVRTSDEQAPLLLFTPAPGA